MRSVIVKHSIALGGHKTSVSLENEFWDGLNKIAELRKTTLSTLVQKIDRERRNANLSSAIRIFVFGHFYAQGSDAQASTQDRRAPAPSSAESTSAP